MPISTTILLKVSVSLGQMPAINCGGVHSTRFYGVKVGTSEAGLDHRDFKFVLAHCAFAHLVLQSVTVNFPPGALTYNLVVQTCADTIQNGGVEEFTVRLSGVSNATLGTDRATGQIVDDDSPAIYR